MPRKEKDRQKRILAVFFALETEFKTGHANNYSGYAELTGIRAFW